MIQIINFLLFYYFCVNRSRTHPYNSATTTKTNCQLAWPWIFFTSFVDEQRRRRRIEYTKHVCCLCSYYTRLIGRWVVRSVGWLGRSRHYCILYIHLRNWKRILKTKGEVPSSMPSSAERRQEARKRETAKCLKLCRQTNTVTCDYSRHDVCMYACMQLSSFVYVWQCCQCVHFFKTFN